MGKYYFFLICVILAWHSSSAIVDCKYKLFTNYCINSLKSYLCWGNKHFATIGVGRFTILGGGGQGLEYWGGGGGRGGQGGPKSQQAHDVVFIGWHNLITSYYKYQSGFVPNHSTTFQLIDIYHQICRTFDNHQYSCMVFFDISKAFDRLWHKGLLFKLKQNGINGKLLLWISNYLSNRKQKVIVKSSSSSQQVVTAGVTQGSVLGPLLFLIYVNDIAESV